MSLQFSHTFNTRDLTIIALFSAVWGVSNSLFSPVVFRMFGLPILCDIIGFACLIVVVWRVRKLGSATMVGIIATLINFLFNPSGVHFLGFTASAIVFDVIARIIGYDSQERYYSTLLIMNSVISAAVAGLIIGTFFMPSPALMKWGGVIGWGGLHAVGGFLGGFIGAILITALSRRGVTNLHEQTSS